VELGELIKSFAREGSIKLNGQYTNIKEAMFELSQEKVQEFMRMADVGLAREEREFLAMMFARCMAQGFAVGYGLGKAEGLTDQQIFV